MSKPVCVNNWLLQYLLKETTKKLLLKFSYSQKLPENAYSNTESSLPETQLVKVIKVCWCHLCCTQYNDSVSINRVI